MTTKQEIAREMLRIFDGKPERWCQGEGARNADGSMTFIGRHAAKLCVFGAWCVAHEDLRTGVDTAASSDACMDAIRDHARTRGFLTEVIWNDAPERTFEDVQKLLTDIAEGKP